MSHRFGKGSTGRSGAAPASDSPKRHPTSWPAASHAAATPRRPGWIDGTWRATDVDGLAICRLSSADVDDVLRIQRHCYGDALVESAAVYRRRLASPGQRSLGWRGRGGLVAYLIGYRSRLDRITPLNGDFDRLDGDADPDFDTGSDTDSDSDSDSDTGYLHDLAVLPTFGRRGLAARLFAAWLAEARDDGLASLALVAVQGARCYWEGHGFRPREPARPTARRALGGYGADACYMARRVGRGAAADGSDAPPGPVTADAWAPLKRGQDPGSRCQ